MHGPAIPTIRLAIERRLRRLGDHPTERDRRRAQEDLANYPPRAWSPALRRQARRLGLRPPGVDGTPGACTFPVVSSANHLGTLVRVDVVTIDAEQDDLSGLGAVHDEVARFVALALDVARRDLDAPTRFRVARDGGLPIDGSSLMLATCLAALSAARGEPLDPDCCATGKVSSHGEVLPVGQVPVKAEIAEAEGFWLLAPRLPNPADATTVRVSTVREAWHHARSSTSRDRLERRARQHARRASRAILARAEPLVRRARPPSADPGPCLGLVGGPGAGKSTLLAEQVRPEGRLIPLWIEAGALEDAPADEALGRYLGDILDDPGLAKRGLGACLSDPDHALGQQCRAPGVVLFVDGVDEQPGDPRALVEALEALVDEVEGLTLRWAGRTQCLSEEGSSEVFGVNGFTLRDLATDPRVQDLPSRLLARLGDPELLAAWRRCPDDRHPDLAELLDELARHEQARSPRCARALDLLAAFSLRRGDQPVSDIVLSAIGRAVLRHEGETVDGDAALRFARDLLRPHLDIDPEEDGQDHRLAPTWPVRAALYRALAAAFDFEEEPDLKRLDPLLSVPACTAYLESRARETGQSTVALLGWCAKRPDADWLSAWLQATAHAVDQEGLAEEVATWAEGRRADAAWGMAEALGGLRAESRREDEEELIERIANQAIHELLGLEGEAEATPDTRPERDVPTHILAAPLLGETLLGVAEGLRRGGELPDLAPLWEEWTAGYAAGTLPMPPVLPSLPEEGPPEAILRAAFYLRLLDEDDGVPDSLRPDEPLPSLLTRAEDLSALGREWGALALLREGTFTEPVLDWLTHQLSWRQFTMSYGLAAATWLAPHAPQQAAQVLASAIADLVGAADAGLAAREAVGEALTGPVLTELTGQLVDRTRDLPEIIEAARCLGVPDEEPLAALEDALFMAVHREALIQRS